MEEAKKIVDSLLSSMGIKEKDIDVQSDTRKTVTVEENIISKKENSINGFTEKDRIVAEMNVKFNAITRENFTEKIVDLQKFFINHHEMLFVFKELLATLLRNENGEFIKMQGILREKKSDDSFIMKGEMEALRDKFHKIGVKINLLTSIRNTFFK